MKIAFVAAGAGDAFCGACNHDVTLIRGLVARGHEVTVIPMYTPLKIEPGAPLPQSEIAYGGINVYLQQLSPLFRRMPAAFDRLLDRPGLLKAASRFAVSTNAASLGPMTVSVLRGLDGRQRKEAAKLLDRLAALKPDVVHLTNTMLAGIAHEARRRIGAAIVATCQGEDAFVESMPAPWMAQARGLMRDSVRSVDRLIAPGHAPARRMAAFLDVDAASIDIVPPGVDVGAYAADAPDEAGPPVIGFLARIAREKGPDLLIQAASLLRQSDAPPFRLIVGGRVADRRYATGLRRLADGLGLRDAVDFVGEVPPHAKPAFLARCEVFCYPCVDFETDGMAALEAQAAGTPVAVPDDGIFPEMIGRTGGGITVDGRDSSSWANALSDILTHRHTWSARRDTIRNAVAQYYSASRMVSEMELVYAAAVEGRSRHATPQETVRED